MAKHAIMPGGFSVPAAGVDADADFADLGGLFEHLRFNAERIQGKRGCQLANPATHNQDLHYPSLEPSCFTASPCVSETSQVEMTGRIRVSCRVDDIAPGEMIYPRGHAVR
jgi:hypothetical protein